jgi:DNA-binding response OmpR family regulator
VATILVAGSDVNIRSILEYRLSKEGYAVSVSEYGANAFEQARTAQPSLIILDLAAPQADGLEFLKKVKSSENTRNIPVLVLSTYRAEELGSDRPELQGVEFVLMPFSPRQLVADVERIVNTG